MISRNILAAALLAALAQAAPPLTTIQDVLYKADGTRFNGTLTISWSSFQAIDQSAIQSQSTTVKVVDGNLRVQLVPTTSSVPPTVYSVTYNSDGRIQFQENWSVPSTAQPVRLRDVRVSTSTTNNTTTSGSSSGSSGDPVNESDVIGLVADLGARPLKGPGYAAGRVAVVNASGALESVSGNPSDCVRVDGSSGPCGADAPSFVDGDSPAGIVDGANTVFALTATPDPVSSLAVYRNGMLQKSGQDYTISGSTLQFLAVSTPQPGDTLLASYRLSGDAGDTNQTYSSPQVLCSGTGNSISATAMTSLGSCSIPAGLLQSGDRVQISFDLEHQGTAAGFSFEVHWGATVAAHRDADATDTLVSGRAEGGIITTGAALSFQSWGAVLPFAAGVARSTDATGAGLTVDFQGKVVAAAGDALVLRNYTVVRLP